MDNDLANIYQTFGVSKYANELEKSGDKDKLGQLNRILAKYILSKIIDDIPQKYLNIFETIDFKNGNNLVLFLKRYIPDFSDKIIIYGKDFCREFSHTGITG